MSRIDIYIDGASKGNPGAAGIGVVICRGNEVIRNISSYIGKTTNNVAEYTALIFALQEALIMKAPEIYVFSDSQLLCRQLNREYKVKNANIAVLFKQAMHLISAFKKVEVCHIPRTQNTGADKLANKAIKEYFKNRS